VAAGPTEAEAGWTMLQVKRTFAASRERVFAAWTDPEQLRRWLTGTVESPHAEADARVGGEFRITMSSPTMGLLARLPGPYRDSVQMVGRYLEVEPPKRLVFTVGWEGMPLVRMDREASTVTVEFNDVGDGTEVVLTHERQPNRRVRAFHRRGWSASLRNLDRLLKAERA
jgi:uncharacterized protein YndB with AHSA1/START domain